VLHEELFYGVCCRMIAKWLSLGNFILPKKSGLNDDMYECYFLLLHGSSVSVETSSQLKFKVEWNMRLF
jgi:hypothetical protein